MQRRRIKQEFSLKERLAQEAEHLKQEAKRLPPGLKRETLLRKARQDEIAAHLTGWLTSSGLRPPE
jgi:hypothetical protein